MSAQYISVGKAFTDSISGGGEQISTSPPLPEQVLGVKTPKFTLHVKDFRYTSGDNLFKNTFPNGFKVAFKEGYNTTWAESHFAMWLKAWHAPTQKHQDLPDPISMRLIGDRLPLKMLTPSEADYYIDMIAKLKKLEGEWSGGLIKPPRPPPSRGPDPRRRPDPMASMLRDYITDDALTQELRRQPSPVMEQVQREPQQWRGGPLHIPVNPYDPFALAPSIGREARRMAEMEEHARYMTEVHRLREAEARAAAIRSQVDQARYAEVGRAVDPRVAAPSIRVDWDAAAWRPDDEF